jgi:hypothetical protein
VKAAFRTSVLGLAWLMAGCAGPPRRATLGPAPASAPLIDTLAIKAHTYFLAQDLLAGRGTGAPGADVAASYIATACRDLGLRPVNGDFFQNVPLVEAAVDSAVITVRTPQGEHRFYYPDDFVPDFGGEQALTSFAGPVVYGGSPIDLAALPDVNGSVVVTGASVRERALMDSLARRGAVALVQLVPDSAVYQLIRRSRGPARAAISEAGVPTSLIPALPWIIGNLALARELVQVAAARSDPEGPGPLGADLSLNLHLTRRPLRARNVACLLPGGTVGARDTAIVFTAHYDHLGVGAPDARGDSIYNGFSDNAAGVGMLLAIAQAMARGPGEPLRHSAIFLFPTAEELGLLGSDYYAARPLWPLARTAAVITLDAGAPPAPPTSWRIAGGTANPLGTVAVDVALAQGWSATVSPATPNSDYYPFARFGVPAVMIIPGPGPYEGLSTDSSVALRQAWNHYHEPADAWAEDFPFRGLRRYAEYAYLLARAWDGRGRREAQSPVRR